jgi:AsmA family protein
MNALARSWSSFPRRHPVWASVLGVLLLLVLLLAFFNWNWARGPVGRLVSSMTGREFRIDGNLDVDYFPLEVHAERLYFANAPWSDEPAMAQVERLDMQVRFWPLFVGQVVLPELAVEKPRLRLERSTAGVGNWVLGSEPRSCESGDCGHSPVRILQLLARGGVLEFREPALQTALDVRFDSASPRSEGALAPLVLMGEGTYRAAPFGLAGVVDSPLALQGEAQPYSLDITARAGGSYARAWGTLAEPLQAEDVTVNFEMGGTDLANLYELAGIALPHTPPYELTGLLRRDGMRIAYTGFTGKVGDSDLSGDGELDLGGPRPKLSAKLQSKLIDFDDLAGFIGGTPATGPGETASAQQQEEKRQQKASGRVLPDTPLELAKLRAMDADVQLTATRVNSPRLPLENMQAHMKLVAGRLILDPLDFGAAGGRLASTVQLDARGTPTQFGMAMKVEGLQLPKLMPRVKALQDSTGTLAGAVDLSGKGNSAASIMASANGNFSVIMGSGRFSNLLLEVAGLDIAESLIFLVGKDKEVRLRCAYADFGITDGVANARAVALDTTDTALLVRGDLDFAKEKLDLKLVPKPKDFSPLSIRAPINIGGTFADPAIAPSSKLVLRGAAVAALVSIAPPLALLGLVETGPGDDTGCLQEPVGGKDGAKDRKPAIQPGPRSMPIQSAPIQ